MDEDGDGGGGFLLDGEGEEQEAEENIGGGGFLIEDENDDTASGGGGVLLDKTSNSIPNGLRQNHAPLTPVAPQFMHKTPNGNLEFEHDDTETAATGSTKSRCHQPPKSKLNGKKSGARKKVIESSDEDLSGPPEMLSDESGDDSDGNATPAPPLPRSTERAKQTSPQIIVSP